MPKPKVFQNERRLAVKLERDLHEAAKEKAERTGKTLSDVVRGLLSGWLRGNSKPKDK